MTKDDINKKFKLIEFDSNIFLSVFEELISIGGVLVALRGISESKKNFIENLITRLDWIKDVYRTINKAELQNKFRTESIPMFINEVKIELGKARQKEKAKISFCGETLKATDVVSAIKLYEKNVNDSLIPKVRKLQKDIDEYIDGVKKNYAKHLAIFHIFMRKEIKAWQDLNEFITKEGICIKNIKNEIVSILKK